MRQKTVVPFIVLGVFGLFSQSVQADKPHPCQQIKQACESAGFVQGEAKDGKGLWMDCINPIMQGQSKPTTSKIALPTVDASVISACKSMHPKFGEGKMAK